MPDRFRHCARFARSLALSSTLLACSETSNEPSTDPAPAPAPAPTATDTKPPTPAPTTQAEPAPTAPTSTAAKNDPPPDESDGGAHISGPLPPPELPASFAA